ncbi:MAG: DUF402 domain-containing protein [Coprobacillus sp.]|nr:DUF402 domain-containing protein [Coprobacillus sp.]
MSVSDHLVRVLSYKHDSSVHRSWEDIFLLDETDDYIAAGSRRNKVIESNGREWISKEPSIYIFSKKEWYNVICMFKKEGISYYTNIASPSSLKDKVITYIDYDLDAKLLPNGSIKVLDKKEYAANKEKYGYPEETDKTIRDTLTEILRLMRDKVFPFDNELIQEYYDVFQSYLSL